MNAILNALARAFVSLLHPKMLWLMIWPVIVALVLWVTLAVLYWGEAAQWIASQLHQWPLYEWAVTVWPLKLVAAWFGWILLLLLFVPAVLITAVLIISVVSMPAMVAHVGGRDYPRLVRRRAAHSPAASGMPLPRSCCSRCSLPSLCRYGWFRCCGRCCPSL